MKISEFYKNLLPFALIVPFTSYASSTINSLKGENTEYESVMILNPSETIVLNFKSSQLLINHQNIQELVGKKISINQNELIKVKIHEESNTVDFSTLDGISVSVNLEAVSNNLPNGR